MIKHLITAAAVAACASSALATTTVGNATLLDTATVVNGTVSPTTFLTYVSGGNGATGYATGSTYGSSGLTAAQAMAAADHEWLQFDGPIIMNSTIALRSVIAVPAIDHGWVAGNLGAEFFEPFEFRIFGCSGASLTANCEEGRITKVWTKGVDDTGARKNADDWTTEWSFEGSYNYFAITSGDRLVGGGVPGYSPGEGEIDALAYANPVPEPSTYALLIAGLGAITLIVRRKKPQSS